MRPTILAHGHNVQIQNTAAGYGMQSGSAFYAQSILQKTAGVNNFPTVDGGAPDHLHYVPAQGLTIPAHGIPAEGSGTAHENLPPYIVVAQIIKVKGVQVNSGGALVGATGPGGAVQVFEQDAQPAPDPNSGAIWIDTDAPTPAPGVASTPALVSVLPGSPTDGQEIYLMISAGVIEHMRYRTAIAGWEWIGSKSVPAYTNVAAFLNGWSNYGGGYPVAGFYKDRERVYLKGLVKPGTWGQKAFTLPTGYRPSAYVHLPMAADDGTAGSGNTRALLRVDNTDGGVQLNSSGVAGAWASLDGISFRSEAAYS